jgi:hypothetical protein
MNSIFQSNGVTNGTDTTGGVSILNEDGQVQCDAMTGCLTACTVCQEPPLPPSPNREADVASRSVVFCLSAAVGFAAVIATVRIRRHVKFRRSAEESEIRVEDNELEITYLLLAEGSRPVVGIDIGIDSEPNSSSNESTTTRPGSKVSESATSIVPGTGNRAPNRAALPWSTIGSSPGLIFAIDREMRVVTWSPGVCGSRPRPPFACACLRPFCGASSCIRDGCLCPDDQRPTRSASRGASFCA